MEQDILKRQFEDLQLQQKRRYAERLQKTRDSNSGEASHLSHNVTNSVSFGVNDDLDLDLNDVTSSSTARLHVALEDANTRMREEIRELKDETGRLRKILGEKDYDIKRLNKRIAKMDDDKKMLASAGAVTDSAATKIVELSKRNRELTAEMEAERAKCLKLMKQISEIQKDNTMTTTTPRKKFSPRNPLALHKEPLIENVEELQDRLQASNIKLAEYRNHIQELKQELKVAHKVLQQEIGEAPSNFPLLLSNGTGFRGRAQQITALQDKVREMEQKLKAASGYHIRPDKNLERIREMEKQRKEQNEELRIEVVKVNELNMDLQRRMDATKARNKVLGNEIKSLKSQLAILTDKGNHDNELIMTLMKQQENMQRLVEHNVNAKDHIEKAGVVITKELHNKQQQEQAEISRLRQLLSERDNRLRQLEQSLQNMTSDQSSPSRSDDSSSYRPLAVFTSPSRTSLGQKNEASQDSSMEQDSNQSELMQELQELQTQCTEQRALYKSALIEQDKLSELVKVLTKRNEELTLSCQESRKNVSDERKKTVRLEQSLEQMKTNYNKDASLRDMDQSALMESKLNELESLLSIQTDENSALKESLESTLRAKQEDIDLFNEMMDQTKSVFLDTLKNLTGNK